MSGNFLKNIFHFKDDNTISVKVESDEDSANQEDFGYEFEGLQRNTENTKGLRRESLKHLEKSQKVALDVPGSSVKKYVKRRRKDDVSSRDFNPEWIEQFMFIQGNNAKPVCLICGSTIAVRKKFNLERHYKRNHGHFELEYPFGSSIRSDYIKMKQIYISAESYVEREGVNPMEVASYEISHLLARSGRSFLDGGVIKETLAIFARHIDDPRVSNQVDEIDLSSDAITRRVVIISNDIQNQIKSAVSSCEYFSLAINQSLDINKTAQLSVFIRTVDSSFCVMEELVALESLNVPISSSDMFEKLRKVLIEDLNSAKLESICTSGNETLTNSEDGCLMLLEKLISRKIMKYHCIINKEALFYDFLDFSYVLTPVVRCITKIRSRPLGGIPLKTLFSEEATDKREMTLHNTLSWLLEGKALERFWNCKQEVIHFLELIGELSEEKKLLQNESWLTDCAFLIDLLSHLNVLVTRLQRKENLFPTLANSMSSFISKLRLFELHFKYKKIEHFPHLKEFNIPNHQFDFKKYYEAISTLRNLFMKRIEEFERDKDYVSLFTNPFVISDNDVEKYEANLQLEILELKNNWVLQSTYKELCSPDKPDLKGFWKAIPRNEFPELIKLALKLTSRFGSTSICDQSISAMESVQNKSQSTLSETHLRDMVLLSTTSIQPRLKDIINGRNKSLLMY